MEPFDARCRKCGADPSAAPSPTSSAAQPLLGSGRIDVLPGRLGEALAHVWPHGLHTLEWCIHADSSAAIAACSSAVLLFADSGREPNCTACSHEDIDDVSLESSGGTQTLWLQGCRTRVLGPTDASGVKFARGTATAASACAEWIVDRANRAMQEECDRLAAELAQGTV